MGGLKCWKSDTFRVIRYTHLADKNWFASYCPFSRKQKSFFPVSRIFSHWFLLRQAFSCFQILANLKVHKGKEGCFIIELIIFSSSFKSHTSNFWPRSNTIASWPFKKKLSDKACFLVFLLFLIWRLSLSYTVVVSNYY